ncbi:hypothetical protein TVAG_329240 [Trichomonas vaginalis G3]|uniref:Uncharacterized protein n=1 Tax=Trichomonas vaginalis (strain ATCC PRA-98 / G3) TaxID=412133 RepID=A2EB92_TRIV3|nr:biological adhesion protein [Trichomonas vaginalis G3]EAY10037.1 hypothetical protein TVAG_329240 [Trichomonas vaginalis G3]KAI5528513.1 biological adhesion protein [Trichomonas vaginalis G3]|eukprot:XP_001322260.1 hypothetical protein [Trichomonas vaginalis G3]
MSKPSPNSPSNQEGSFGSGRSSGASPSSGKNSSFNASNSDLSMTENDFQIRLQILQKKHEKEIAALTNDLNLSREENIEKSTKIHQLENERDSKIQEQQRINSELARKNIQLSTQIESFLAMLSSKTGEDIQSLKDASLVISNIIAQSGSTSDSLASIQQVNSEMGETLAAFQAKLQELKSENKALRASLKKASSQLDLAQGNEDIIQPYTQKIEELQRKAQLDLENYQEDIEERDSKIESLKKQVQTLRNQLQYDQDVQSDNSKQLQETQMTLLQEKLQMANDELSRKQKESQTLQENLTKSESIIADLQKKVDDLQNELSDRDDFISQTNAQTDDLKKKKDIAREALKTFEAELASSRTRIQELELHLSMSQETIKSLQSNKGIEDTRNKYVASCDTVATQEAKLLRESLESLEEVLKTQRQEITSLTKQRTELISSLISAGQAIEKAEKLTSEKNQIISNLKMNLKEVSQDDRLAKENEEFSVAFDNILELIPTDLVDYVTSLHTFSPPEILTKVVDALVHHKSDSLQNDDSNLEHRYISMLSHMKNLINLLKKLTKTTGPSTEERQFMLRQCAIVGRYLDEESYMLPNEEFSRCSLFDPHEVNDPEKMLKIFFDFVDEDKIDQTPFRELFTLFSCLIQVNVMLMSSSDELRKVAAKFAAQKTFNMELKSKNKELEEKLEIAGQERILLTPVLSKFLAKVPQEFGDLVREFCEVMKDGPLSTAEGQRLKSEIEEAKLELKNTKQKYEEEIEKLQKEKKEFCQKAMEITQQTDKEIHQMAQEFNAQIDEISTQLQNAKTERDTMINELEQTKKRHNDDMENKKQEIGEFQHRLDDAISRIKATQKELEDAKVDAIKARNDKETITKNAQQDIANLYSQLQKEKQRKLRLKEKLQNIEENNVKIINDVQQRADSLANQYGTSLQRLQAELDSERSKNKELTEKVTQLNPIIEDSLKQLSQSRAAEKMANLRAEDSKAALEQERINNQAKIRTILSTNEAKHKQIVDEMKANFNKVKMAVALVTSIDYNKYNDREFAENSQKILSETFQSRDSVIARDAFNLRRSLALPDDENLSDLFKAMQNELFTADERAKKTEQNLSDLTKKSDTVSRENKRLEKSREELLEWIRWGKSIFRQISDVDVASTATPSEIRFLLEERLLSSFNYTNICRKLDLLRTQKSLLANGKTFLATKNSLVKSIRPIIVSTVFCRILQGMSCCVPAQFSVPKPEKPGKKSVVPVE